MSVTVLGISAYYHDAAAALVRDGVIVAAAEEERFSRRKHDPRLPRHAINYVLEEAFISPRELDAVVFYEDPALSIDRAVTSLLAVAPAGEAQWLAAAPALLATRPSIAAAVRRELGSDVPVLCTRHHLAHAASAFYPSPFEQAAVLTVDGVGEWATTTIGAGEGTDLRLLDELQYPHSLGLLYSAFTGFCGFAVNDGEYKLMGLAPFGEPRFADLIRERLFFQRADGSFRLEMRYFDYLDGLGMTNAGFADLFGGPTREPEAPITRRELDLAASVQRVAEEALLALARHARERTGLPNLVLAGGVALNCVANGRLQRSGLFDQIWIQPAAGDAGGALGAALLASHQHFGLPRPPRGAGKDAQQGSLLGPAFSGAEVRAFLDRFEHPYEEVADPAERAARIAQAVAGGQIVGLFSGRMEYGPRALGARSLLGDPRRPETQRELNRAIKQRESFRPFAPAVLAERAAGYFDLDVESPYMLLVAPVREDHRVAGINAAGDAVEDLPARAGRVRSDVPAVTHVDYSARIQTVREEDSPALHAILLAFERLTGCPVLVNTSFNVRDEPIVCTPQDAYRCFMRCGAELLVLEDCLVYRDRQRQPDTEPARAAVAKPAEPDIAGQEAARTFFHERLVPLAARLREAGVHLVPLGPDGSESSWYRAAPSGPSLFTREPEQLADALRGFWSGDARVALIEPLLALREQLQPAAPEPSEVPADRYVTF